MRNSPFQLVNYDMFRSVLNDAAGSRIKSKGTSTFLYDRSNKVLAVMRAPTMDQQGYCYPPRYFIRQQSYPAKQPAGIFH